MNRNNPLQLDMFPPEAHLRCIDPAHNKWRFYCLSVQPTLFGDWVLVKEWGRIGRHGHTRHEHYPSIGDALTRLHDTLQSKRKRGYRLFSS